MKLYQQHPFYCGIALHANAMYVCVVDAQGTGLKGQAGLKDWFCPGLATTLSYVLVTGTNWS